MTAVTEAILTYKGFTIEQFADDRYYVESKDKAYRVNTLADVKALIEMLVG